MSRERSQRRGRNRSVRRSLNGELGPFLILWSVLENACQKIAERFMHSS